MINFTWHCGASVLVDDAYSKWDVIAPTIDEAHAKAYKYVNESAVLDEGTLDIDMDEVQLAMNFANLACEDNEPFEPNEYYIEALKEIRKKFPDVYADMENIVCNANKRGELE